MIPGPLRFKSGGLEDEGGHCRVKRFIVLCLPRGRCPSTWIGAAPGSDGPPTSCRGGGSPRPKGFLSNDAERAERFEADGADDAREFLPRHEISEPEADLVWEAIAAHATPGIPSTRGLKSHSRTLVRPRTWSVLDLMNRRYSGAIRSSPLFRAMTSRMSSFSFRPAQL